MGGGVEFNATKCKGMDHCWVLKVNQNVIKIRSFTLVELFNYFFIFLNYGPRGFLNCLSNRLSTTKQSI